MAQDKGQMDKQLSTILCVYTEEKGLKGKK
jgi:hypothetical protein